jgi:hypothetical protein
MGRQALAWKNSPLFLYLLKNIVSAPGLEPVTSCVRIGRVVCKAVSVDDQQSDGRVLGNGSARVKEKLSGSNVRHYERSFAERGQNCNQGY